MWYDVYVRCNGANIQVWRAQRGSGSEMAQVLSTSSATVTSTSKFKVHSYGSWRFDDLRMVSDSLSSTTTYTYFDANKLTTSTSPSDGNMTYEYDTWGRMVTKNLQSGAHIAAYTYRYDSKLCTVTSTIPDESDVTNNYDGAGKLRSITTGGATKKLRWDNGWHPINLEDANGNLTTTFVHDPAREAAGSVLAAHVGSDPASGGTWAYLSQDHLGSTRHLRGQDRASLGAYEYTVYGDPYIATGMDLPQKFTGHWQMPQAGLYHAPYRMYAPNLARWLTRDPLGMVDGPNVYGYVKGQAVAATDPLGLGRWTEAECEQIFQGCKLDAAHLLWVYMNALGWLAPSLDTAVAFVGDICCALMKKRGIVTVYTAIGCAIGLAASELMVFWITDARRFVRDDTKHCTAFYANCIRRARQ